MSDWQACFQMEAGKTYRVRYVRPWEDVVREGVFRFEGEVLSPTNSAVVIIDPHAMGDASYPGPIRILEIEELLLGARFDVENAKGEIR